MRPAHEILLAPCMTEKASALAEARPIVVFKVPVDANKSEIKNAVQGTFKLEVESVRTMIVRGKIKRRGRTIGKRNNWKKAIVTLAGSEAPDIFGMTAD